MWSNILPIFQTVVEWLAKIFNFLAGRSKQTLL